MDSNRQKKKMIQRGVKRLKNTPGWDPANHVRTSALEQLRDLDQECQNERAYKESEVCDACQQARTENNDETALCPAHLQEALGFG